jgi:hypothetical protein
MPAKTHKAKPNNTDWYDAPAACPQCQGTRQVTAHMVPGDPADTMPCPACTPHAPAPAPARTSARTHRRTAKWLPDAANGLRRLRLTIHTLAGERISHDYELEQTATGWRLYRLDITASPPAVIVYTITIHPTGAYTCDCPAATRGKQQYVCKHAAGLRAALAALPF